MKCTVNEHVFMNLALLSKKIKNKKSCWFLRIEKITCVSWIPHALIGIINVVLNLHNNNTFCLVHVGFGRMKKVWQMYYRLFLMSRICKCAICVNVYVDNLDTQWRILNEIIVDKHICDITSNKSSGASQGPYGDKVAPKKPCRDHRDHIPQPTQIQIDGKFMISYIMTILKILSWVSLYNNCRTLVDCSMIKCTCTQLLQACIIYDSNDIDNAWCFLVSKSNVVWNSQKLNMWGFHILLRATSHTRLRTRDHCTSSTLIGGKGRASPSLLHTTLVGPTN